MSTSTFGLPFQSLSRDSAIVVPKGRHGVGTRRRDQSRSVDAAPLVNRPRRAPPVGSSLRNQ